MTRTREEIQEEIEWQEETLQSIEGQTIFYNIRNRIYGAMGLILSGIVFYGSQNMDSGLGKYGVVLTAGTLAMECLGDLLTGKHHFVSYRFLGITPKQEINKLEKELETLNISQENA